MNVGYPEKDREEQKLIQFATPSKLGRRNQNIWLWRLT